MWKLRCGHNLVRCIHGDEIIAAKYRRVRCLDCGRALKGPMPEFCHVTRQPHSSGDPFAVETRN